MIALLGQLASDSAKWDGDSDHYLYRLGDGAATGVSLPIHQLIARGVTKVIAFANNDNPFVADKSKWSPKNGSPNFVADASIDGTTPLWFGIETFQTKYGSIDYDTSHSQIFPTSEWADFIDCLQDAANSGKGTFCKKTMTTVANAWWGIPSGMEIELAYFYLKASEEYEKLLPAETKAEVDDKENGDIRNWPQVFTLTNNAKPLNLENVLKNEVGITDISVPEANLLASFTKWVTKQHMNELSSMFTGDLSPPTLSPTPAPTADFWERFTRSF